MLSLFLSFHLTIPKGFLIGAITKDIKEFDFLCLIKRSDKLILARVSP